MFKGLHTDTVQKNDLLQTEKTFKLRTSDKGIGRRLTTQEYNQLIILTALLSEEIFQYVVCMRSLNLFVVGGRSLIQVSYGESVRSFANVLIVKLRIVFLSPYFIDHIYGITQFSLPNKAVECCV